jgi:hypothetical protein
MTAQFMNHQQALEEHATERYLLGEMTAEQRRAFEEHYLECAECLEAVTFGADFMEAGRQVALEDKSMRVSPAVPTWRERLLAVVPGGLRLVPALAVALLLVGVIGYQRLQIHQLNLQGGPKVARAEYRYTLTGIAHGSPEAKLVQVPRDAVVSLSVEYDRSGDYVSYRAQILSASGELKQTVDLPDTPGNMATLAVLPGSLSPGQYALVVLGRTPDGVEKEVGRGSFNLRIAN